MGGLSLFKGLRLFFLPNVPAATFIQRATSIPDSRVNDDRCRNLIRVAATNYSKYRRLGLPTSAINSQ